MCKIPWHMHFTHEEHGINTFPCNIPWNMHSISWVCHNTQVEHGFLRMCYLVAITDCICWFKWSNFSQAAPRFFINALHQFWVCPFFTKIFSLAYLRCVFLRIFSVILQRWQPSNIDHPSHSYIVNDHFICSSYTAILILVPTYIDVIISVTNLGATISFDFQHEN